MTLQALKDGVQDVAVKVLAASQFGGIPEGLQLQVLKKVSTGKRVGKEQKKNRKKRENLEMFMPLGVITRGSVPRSSPGYRSARNSNKAFLSFHMWHGCHKQGCDNKLVASAGF